MSVKPKKAQGDSSNLSDACLRLATRVEDTCEIVCASFVYPDPQERRNHLIEFGNKLLFEAFPFFTWLERTRHPGTVDLEKRRLKLIEQEAIACAASELPQCDGGQLRMLPPDHPTTPAMMRFGVLRATTMLVGQSLRAWAGQIESETAFNGRKSKNSTGKGTPGGDNRSKAPLILAGLIEHHKYRDGGCLNREPVAVNKFAKELGVGSGSVSRYLDKKFGGYKKYCHMCRSGEISTWLKGLSGDITPKDLRNNLGDRSNELSSD